jgi:hypothetical protein
LLEARGGRRTLLLAVTALIAEAEETLYDADMAGLLEASRRAAVARLSVAVITLLGSCHAVVATLLAGSTIGRTGVPFFYCLAVEKASVQRVTVSIVTRFISVAHSIATQAARATGTRAAVPSSNRFAVGRAAIAIVEVSIVARLVTFTCSVATIVAALAWHVTQPTCLELASARAAI